MVAGAEQGPGQMGHGQSNEHDGAAIGCHDGHQHSRTDNNLQAGLPDVEPQVAGIAVAQQQEVHGFHQQKTERQQNAHEDDEEHHLVAADAAERAQSPHHEGLDVLLGRQELQHSDDGIGQIANHHTYY